MGRTVYFGKSIGREGRAGWCELGRTGANADLVILSYGEMFNSQSLLDNDAVFGESVLLEFGPGSIVGAVVMEGTETSIRSKGAEHAARVSENAPDVPRWRTIDQGRME